ncbi:ABC transporter substrate-binding protein [Streptomyces sp. NBC_01353]|uniref:ABC transporter substrate-binding protein n=1 Tax=Streptomyces sp. NBC_01353 TaxID=2903835 RepID=UPI002E2FA812|nr:ABC transporter substrate-binding protein [Streptomyces sp. NBC_01353]
MTWRRTLLPAAALVPLLAGCSAPSEQDPAAKAAPGFPYTVSNCGMKTTYQAPPRRAVTMNQHVTEVMLALGLEKSLVGTAYLDDRILPAYKKAYDAVPVLAKEYPAKEALLAANPDFVYGGYASAFDAKVGRSRDDLKAAGFNTRLNMEYCPSGASSLADLYQEVDEVGRTFGVPDRGARWTAEAKKTVAATEKKLNGLAPLSVFVYDSGDKTAFTAGGKGIGNELITRAGGRNVFADLDKAFGDVTWEQVVARKPDVIVIYDYGSTTVEQKKKRLLDDPALKDVPAIKNKRFAVMPLSDAVLGVRVPAAIEKLAAQLHPAR